MDRSKLLGSCILATLIGAPALAQNVQPSQEADAQQPLDSASGSTAGTQDIVVLGTRASDRTAQEKKRNSDQIVDSVVAEDIGALPDFNVAEALQRVPGVQLDRNEFTGEGGSIRIRGLSQITTSLEGRSIFSGVGRQLNLGEIPAGLVARVDVYKSPQADQLEPGLGGIVDVRLRRPLDFKGFTASFSARGLYRSLVGNVNPSLSGLVGQRWDTGAGEIGVVLAGIYDKRKFRTDRLAVEPFFDRRNLFDLNRNGVLGTEAEDSIYVPGTLTARYSVGQFQRWALGGGVQYRPTPDFEVYVDGLYNDYTGKQNHSYIAPRLNSTLFGARATLAPDFVLRPDGRTFESGTLLNVPFNSSTYIQDDKNNVWQIGTGAKWHNERLTASYDVSLIRSKVDGYFKEFSLGGIAPRFFMDFKPKTPFYDYQGIDVRDPATLQPQFLTLRRYPNTGQELAERVDLKWRTQLPFIESVAAGLRFTQRTSRRIGRDASFTVTGLRSTVPLASITGITPGGLLGGGLGLTDTRWAAPNADAVRDFDARLVSYGLAAGLPPFRDNLTYSFKEDGTAGYVMGNIRQPLFGLELTGNVGARYVRTRQQSDGFRNARGSTTIFLPIQDERTYENVLPSLNLALRVTPDIILRVAAARTVTKPNFADLNPTRVLNYDSLTGSGGNPDLKPYFANQYDATAEWYFGRPGSLYVNVFRKDVDGFYQTVTQPEEIDGQTFRISQVVNASDARITGWEIGYQQVYDFLPSILSGLGSRFSYTRVNGKQSFPNQAASQPLTGLSRNTYNATLNYELGGVRARVAYNRRGSYPVSLTPGGALNLPQVRRAYGQLDASVTYQFSAKLAVFFDASNLTNQRGEEYYTLRTQPRAFFLSDQSFSGGVRVSF